MSQRPASPTDLRVEVLDSADALRATAREWDDLWRRSDVTLPTVCAEPAALWIDTFAPDATIRISTVRQADRLVAALPLLGRKLARFVPVGDLTLNHWSPNGELLLDTEADAAAIVDRLADAVCDLPWPLLWFEMVPHEADRWAALAESLVGRGARVEVRPGHQIGRVSLEQPFDDYMAQRSKNLRRSVQKDLAQLERMGQVELRLLDHLHPDEVEEALQRAFVLEDSGWKGAGGTSVLKNEGIFDFYLRQAGYFADCGALRVAFLECGDRAIAFELGWIGKGVYHSFKVGYDEDYRKFGPGHLLRYRLIEQGCADPGLHHIDYQGPITEALRPWATETYAIGRLTVCLPRLSSRALWSGLKTARHISRSLRHAATWLS